MQLNANSRAYSELRCESHTLGSKTLISFNFGFMLSLFGFHLIFLSFVFNSESKIEIMEESELQIIFSGERTRVRLNHHFDPTKH